jgi:prophage tail gpP-like protein
MTSLAARAAATPTQAVTLKAGGVMFTDFVGVHIERDLQALAGRFELVCFDKIRAGAALGPPPTVPTPLLTGAAAQVAIDGETVLIGWIDKVSLHADGDTLSCTVTGRDKTGDLVDCAALPAGPAEFRNVDLLHVAQTVCAPFGIPVRADVGIGAPFVRLSCHPQETARSFLDVAARQRALLVTSDGVGGLVLTRGGVTRAPESLWFGVNVLDVNSDDDWSHRFSDYFVKGQTPAANGRRVGVPPALTHGVTPTGAAATSAPGAASSIEAGGAIMTGHAIDPQVTRWRPTVRLARSQAGSSTVQAQAEWALRVARGQSHALHYRVLDWRDKPGGTLWRPNQVTGVWDPYCGIDGDMLIAGVAYGYDEEGMLTTLRVVDRSAYDLIDLAPAPTPGHRARRPSHPRAQRTGLA